MFAKLLTGEAPRRVVIAAVITAVLLGLTQLSPALRDLFWDTSVLLGAYAVVFMLLLGFSWVFKNLKRKRSN